jgi:hypothetical protein
MKYCEDCKSFQASIFDAVCLNENAKRKGYALVRRECYPKATEERDEGNCGPEGKLWEAKD